MSCLIFLKFDTFNLFVNLSAMFFLNSEFIMSDLAQNKTAVHFQIKIVIVINI